ncbi:MAG TPA: protein kinase [Bryobacteraceae bacterium]|nr:protein kinase [Bryobacteraceae bacterium]
MTPDKWRRAYRLYQEISDLPAPERRAYLDSADADPEVVAEVVTLLERAATSRGSGDEARAGAEPGLSAGAVFGHYVIERPLGRGGMSEVYAARDTQLERTVALKFLRAEQAGTPSAANRLVSEAKAASALNHPNIVTVYEVVHQDSAFTIAMELVEGKSLRELCGQPQPAAQVIEWGRQIAAALAVVHAHGIIHRDVKPENIMLRPDGLIKVLDFGLARAGASGGLVSEPHNASAGLPVGTLRYMSPEQTRGEALTAASDVFSLGIVLYELLAGQHPFASESLVASARAILASQPPPPSSLNRSVPPELDRLLLAMLAKQPDARPAGEETARSLGALAARLGEPARIRRRWILLAVAALGTLALAVVLALDFRPPAGDTVTEILPFTTLPGEQLTPSFSPDGQTVAFTSGSQSPPHGAVCIQPVNRGKETCLTGPSEIAYSPAWSPDGAWIAYVTGSWGVGTAVWIQSPATRETRKLADISSGVWPTERSLAWTHDSKNVLVTERRGIVLVPLHGAVRTLIPTPEGVSDYGPDVSSDGRELVFTRNSQFAASLYYTSLNAPGPLRRVSLPHAPPVLDACWVPNRRELVVASGSVGEIWQVPLNGRPRLLARDPYRILDPAISPDGRRIVYVQDRSDFNLWTLNLVGAHREPERCDPLSSTRDEFFPQYSPDGQRIAFESNRSGYEEIWVGQRDGGALRQLTHFDGPQTGSPHWSPSGQRITFDSRVAGVGTIFVIASAGGNPTAVSPKGIDSFVPSWSHDGQWIYFVSRGSGRDEVWRVRPDGQQPVQVTHGGGYAAIDSLDGRFLYYVKSRAGDEGLWRLSLATGEEVRVAPRVIDAAFAVNPDGLYYLTSRDDHRLFIEKWPYGAAQPIPIASPSKAVLGMTVRSDGREMMLGLQDAHVSQLMLMTLRPR